MKLRNLLLVLAGASLLAGCGKTDTSEKKSEEPKSQEQRSTEETTSSDEVVSSEDSTTNGAEVLNDDISEFLAANLNDVVTVRTFVQAKQSWWDNKASIYTQTTDGGVFIYNMPITEDEYEFLEPGTFIEVTGTKTEYRGELEIADVTSFRILDGLAYIAAPLDVTDLLGTDDLIKHQNEYVSFNHLTIEASFAEGSEEEVPFLYNWNGSGDRGNDLYFKASVDGKTYQFTVESYLCGADTDVYKAVEALKIGDVVNLTGFLYWYDGANPHITEVSFPEKDYDISAFVDGNLNDVVTVKTYVQAKQSWWDDKATLYTQTPDGAVFIYNMPISEADYALLVPGTLIEVTGTKSEYRGEVEIADVTSFKIVEADPYIPTPLDVTNLLGTDDLIKHQNELVSFFALKIEASYAEGSEEPVPFLYNWNGSGDRGNDLYFKASVDGNTYQFTVESYLCGADTDVYKAVEALKIGDYVALTGFLYWYDGANPHITEVSTLK